jgi:hypothetical protein
MLKIIATVLMIGFVTMQAGAGADDCTKHVNASAIVHDVHRGRERFQVDHQTLECGQGKVGQEQGKVDRLPAAVGRQKAERPEELVIPRDVHDELTMVLGLLGPRRWDVLLALNRSDSRAAECPVLVQDRKTFAPSEP